ncbi:MULTISPECIES: hypothetical protein [Nostoc]|jgi:hypothetical protein|uniref:Uncharacterized protein n=2 Tax=Nostoc TaxID=1177 RepID=A0ABR8IB59_9NOSO|nr:MULTISPECIES: hypothetical protein [Nostoc]MBD2560702.1 hypothetical protein [Nostoc linckia FACHB-391]MBD2648201.1 hypothetical protein [Nostoc foliaceum FACHB-393]
MTKLKIQEYIAKHKGEFPDGKIHHELPMPTDAISVVSDPQNWHCYPDNVVRIFLSSYKEDGEEQYLVGVGDYKHPTICTNVYSSLDDVCSFIANRPEQISKEYLEICGFYFLEIPISRAYRI